MPLDRAGIRISLGVGASALAGLSAFLFVSSSLLLAEELPSPDIPTAPPPTAPSVSDPASHSASISAHASAAAPESASADSLPHPTPSPTLPVNTAVMVKTGPRKSRIEEAVDIKADKLKARELQNEGQAFFVSNQYEQALAKFKSSREIDPDFLPAWFYAIRTLHLLKRKDEAQALSAELLKRKPGLRMMPMFKGPAKPSHPATPAAAPSTAPVES